MTTLYAKDADQAKKHLAEYCQPHNNRDAMLKEFVAYAIRERFGLFDGQLRFPSRPNEKRNGFRKNLWWMLNGETFGYGDLDDEDFIRIQESLSAHEQFMGFNEHHGTQWQQRTNPVVIIRHDSIDFPDPIR